MITTVKFIGLLVWMYTQNVGYHVLMPQFPGANHDSVIAYPKSDRVSGNDPKTEWKVAGSFKVGKVDWDYVAVKKEFITFSGASDTVPSAVNQPHLACCCVPMQEGIKDEYTSLRLPINERKSAQIDITRGVSSLFTTKYGSISTQIKMTTSERVGITITGTQGEGNNLKTMNFAPGATVVFGVTPLCVLEENCPTTMAAGDFLMYYQMGKNPKAVQCQSAPSNCATCASGQSCPTACPIEKITQGPNIDCSNSQWP